MRVNSVDFDDSISNKMFLVKFKDMCADKVIWIANICDCLFPIIFSEVFGNSVIIQTQITLFWE